MTRGELGDSLAFMNALLNASSGILVFLGRAAIKRGDRARHRQLMLTAVSTSAIFLVTYVTRVILTGTHADPHHGIVHTVYLFVLTSHMFLAMMVLPLVIVLLVRALKGQFARHRKLARYTYPIWLYVSVTGVIVYVMLYHLPV